MPIVLASAAFVLIWATGFIVARFVADHADPLTFIALRHLLSAAVFVALCAAARVAWPREPRAWLDAMVAGMLMHGVYVGGVFWAVRHGLPAGVTALVTGLHPVFTAALAIALLHERVSARQWAGIATGFVGIGLVVSPALDSLAGVPWASLASALVATIGFALGNIWQKRSRPAMDLRANAAIQYLGALLLVGPVALAFEDHRFDNSATLWSAMAWAVLVLSVGAISLLLTLLKRGEASRVAPLVYLSPPVAALLAFLLFDERLVPLQLGGMVLAAAGAFAAGSFRREALASLR